MHCACSGSVLIFLMLQSSCQLSLGGNSLHYIMEASRFLDDDLHQTVVLHRPKPRTSLQIPQKCISQYLTKAKFLDKSCVDNECFLPPPWKNSGENAELTFDWISQYLYCGQSYDVHTNYKKSKEIDSSLFLWEMDETRNTDRTNLAGSR